MDDEDEMWADEYEAWCDEQDALFNMEMDEATDGN